MAITQFPLVNVYNVTSVLIAGTCSEDKLAVSLVVTDSAAKTSIPIPNIVCTSGVWFKHKDLSTLPDGFLIATATHTDQAGNTGTSPQAQSVKDTTLPDLAITSFPKVTSANQNAVILSGTCTKDKYSIEVSVADWSNPESAILNKGITCLDGLWQTTPQNLSSLSDGLLNATATQVDGVGNVITATATSTKNTNVESIN